MNMFYFLNVSTFLTTIIFVAYCNEMHITVSFRRSHLAADLF